MKQDKIGENILFLFVVELQNVVEYFLCAGEICTTLVDSTVSLRFKFTAFRGRREEGKNI